MFLETETNAGIKAISHFLGPFNSRSTSFIFDRSGSACLNISNVLQKGKDVYIFILFVLVFAYFRNKDVQHF